MAKTRESPRPFLFTTIISAGYLESVWPRYNFCVQPVHVSTSGEKYLGTPSYDTEKVTPE